MLKLALVEKGVILPSSHYTLPGERTNGPRSSPSQSAPAEGSLASLMQEEDVQHQIEQALEKENLDRERALAGEESEGESSEAGSVRNSAALAGDLEELKAKVERFQSRQALSEFPAVQAASEEVVTCYK